MQSIVINLKLSLSVVYLLIADTGHLLVLVVQANWYVMLILGWLEVAVLWYIVAFQWLMILSSSTFNFREIISEF